MATLAEYGPEVRAEVKQVREVVASLHEQLIKWNLVVWTAGNVSQRLRTADLMVIKPSGLRYEYLTPSSMVVCDLDGNVVDGAESPSSDTASHAYIYRHMPDVYGVVHTHSTYATAWAATGQNIPCGLTMMGDEFGGDVPARAESPEQVSGDSVLSDAINTLIVLGYTRAEATSALAGLGGLGLEDMIKAALKKLSVMG